MKEVSHGLETFLQQVINGLSLGSVYALIAVGYSLVYSVLLFSNFAHGGFMVVGGYACYAALKVLGANIWVASAMSLVGAGIVAVVTERLAYKPIRERTNVTLYLLIASMGMSIVIENLFVIAWQIASGLGAKVEVKAEAEKIYEAFYPQHGAKLLSQLQYPPL